MSQLCDISYLIAHVRKLTHKGGQPISKMVDEGSLFSIWNGTKHSEGYSHTTFLQFVFLATEVQ